MCVTGMDCAFFFFRPASCAQSASAIADRWLKLALVKIYPSLSRLTTSRLPPACGIASCGKYGPPMGVACRQTPCKIHHLGAFSWHYATHPGLGALSCCVGKRKKQRRHTFAEAHKSVSMPPPQEFVRNATPWSC